jgi:hypothetical protein
MDIFRLTALLRFCVSCFFLVSLVEVVRATRWQQGPPRNIAGLPVRNADGSGINYNRREGLATSGFGSSENAAPKSNGAFVLEPQGFVPSHAIAAPRPFWQYAIFGSAIGQSNIVIAPAPTGVAPEIILGGNSVGSTYYPDDFWQVLRFNATTGNFDQIFVSPIFTDPNHGYINRIGLGNVVGDAALEIVVMLEDGRVFLYDFKTKVELGHITTGKSHLTGMSLTDLNRDGRADLILTNLDDLFVFSGAGSLLWQVPGAGGYDVVAGQMDNDSAIEIAATNGKVVDAASHTVQWTRNGGFGVHLKLAPLAGKHYQQLIAAEQWSFVYSYDVARQLPLWSINTPQDIGAIQIADVDGNGTPELIIGDNQWGTLHVHDLGVQAEKWHTGNPEHGVTSIAAGDVDGDGVRDLLWGAGWTSTGSDYLYVAKTNSDHAIKWRSIDLTGPFVGPAIGDLDGDGKSELVVCSFQSESGYDTGRILVFNLDTLALRGISAPVVDNYAVTGVHDLKLRDIDGDGRAEIVIASDNSYDGAIEIWNFDSSNAFTRKWSNTTQPLGSPFTFVEVADLDGNGTREIIAGNTIAHSGSEGVYVYIYDYPSGANPWRSPNMQVGFNSITGLVVQDLDSNGSKEIAALVDSGDLYTIDGATRTVRNLRRNTHGTFLTARSNPSGLVLADDAGTAHFLQYSNSAYTEAFARFLHAPPLDGISITSNNALWIGAWGALTLRRPPSYSTTAWQTAGVGYGFGRFVATDVRNAATRVFSSSIHAVAGISDAPPAAAPVQALNLSTRLGVQTGDNVLIGGFIITGSLPKKVIVRGIGPSLAQTGVQGVLANPTLDLYAGQNLLAHNDDWRSSQAADIIASRLAPTNNLESAIVYTLEPGAYTAIVRGANGGTGTGLVEVYDLDPMRFSKLANISTRGLIGVNDNVMIGGFIVGSGTLGTKVVVRGLGPSLTAAGVPHALANPTLELRDGNGALLAFNDNWKDTQSAELQATHIQPRNDAEAGIVRTLGAGAYTAIARGKNNSTGVALVEVYFLN